MKIIKKILKLKNDNKCLNEKRNKNTIIITSLSVLLGLSLVLNIYQLLNPRTEFTKEEINYTVSNDGVVYINSNIGNYSVNDNQIRKMKNKIDFYDKYAVIIPDGYSSSLSYDCWKKNGSPSPFVIYNIENAQKNGYWKSC